MMEHCKKLVLVPHETVSKLQEKKPVERTAEVVMNDLDKEMQQILKQKAEDSEKWKLYEQALQKYLYFVNERKKPMELLVPDVGTSKHEISLKQKLLSITPSKFQDSAAYLFDHLSSEEAKKFISWDENGKASVGNQTLPSIIDLISDAVRTRDIPKINKWETFANVLKSLSTPLEIIGNKKYKEALQSQGGSGLSLHNVNYTEKKDIHKTKKNTIQNKKSKTKRTKSTNWKRWTR